MERAPDARPHGAALPLALILLAVLTVIAVAAVSLSGQERINAGSYSRIDFVNECANAAQAKMWSELAYSAGYLTAPVTVTSVRMKDGTKFTSPAHYDQPPTAIVKNVVLSVQSSSGAGASSSEQDCTNSACGLAPPGATQLVTAHCVDTRGRELEIEIGVRFAF